MASLKLNNSNAMSLNMKQLLLYVVLFLMASCANRPSYKEEIIELPIETWISDYAQKNPNFLNNEVTKEKASADLIKALEDTTNCDWISNIPVELKDINKNGKKYYAHFGSYLMQSNFSYESNPQIEEVNFDAIMEIPDSIVGKLKEDEIYMLDAKIISRIKNGNLADFIIGKSCSYWNWIVSINNDDITKENVVIDLGVLFCDFKNLETYSDRKTKRVKI